MPGPMGAEEIRKLRAQREAQRMTGPGVPSTLAGPSRFQEATPPQPLTAAGTAIGEAGEAAAGQTLEASGLGQVTAGGLASGAGAVAGGSLLPPLVRMASGNLLRAGSPLMQAGTQLFLRGAGAALGGVAGGELVRRREETGPEAIERRLTDAAFGLAGELAYPAAKAGVRAVRSLPGRLKALLGGATTRHAPNLVPGAEATQALLTRYGATATPAQLRTDWPTRTVENMLEASMGGSGRYESTRAGATVAVGQAWRDAIPRFGREMSEQEIGQMVDAAILGSRDAQKSVVDAAYKSARRLAAERGVSDDVVFLDDVYRKLLSDEALQSRKHDPLVKQLTSILDDLADPEAMPLIRSLKGSNLMPVSFRQAEALRSTLNDLAYSTEGQLIRGTAGLLKPYGKAVDDAIEMASARLNVPEVRAAYLGARELAKENVRIFNDEILAELVGKRRPEQIAEALYQAGAPSRFDALHELTQNPRFHEAIRASIGGGSVDEWFQAIQNGYLNRILLQSGERTSTTTGATYAEPHWKGVLSRLTSSRGTFESIFRDPQQRQNLETIARAGATVESRAPSTRTGAIFFQLKQAGMAANVLGAAATMSLKGISPEAVGFLLIPGGVASVTTSRHFSNFLLRRSLGASARVGTLSGRALAQWGSQEMGKIVSELRTSRIPFTYVDPKGQQTTYDPKTETVTGIHAPEKPRSKF